jgi:hypothetical protein
MIHRHRMKSPRTNGTVSLKPAGKTTGAAGSLRPIELKQTAIKTTPVSLSPKGPA